MGLKLPEVKEYEKSFLPDVVDNVLTLAAKLLDFSVKAKVVRIEEMEAEAFFRVFFFLLRFDSYFACGLYLNRKILPCLFFLHWFAVHFKKIEC